MIVTTILLLAVQAAPMPPVPPSPVPGATVVREIVIHGGKHEQHDGAAKGEHRQVRIVRAPGSTGANRPLLEQCEGETLVDVDERSSTAQGGEEQRTRVLICRAKGTSEVGAVQRLRDAAKRFSADSTLSVEARNRVLTAINSAIARLDARE
jgi:hypothetical protein